ncbi:MAG: mannose-1-phosphate guanylyltransferase [Bacteroidales bacterium]|nr:mannose-1-phosphate guanylyltransferase [Bacteroidales bacterium]
MSNHVVIMAGGVGSRLYPLSTPERPKQFLDLLGCGKPLLRLTYERFLAVDPDAVFWVVTSAEYVHFVREIVPEIPEAQILAEPAARNTAPCIALACWKIKAGWPDANIVVTPADAYVPDVQAFAVTVRTALDFTACSDAVVCLGINPTSPHTGYGYIQAPAEPGKVVKVTAFKEKPSLEVAQAYLAAGGYWWNAGIFVWNVRTIESELRAHAPQICGVMDSIAESFGTPAESQTIGELFPTCEKISIDYAVMEKSQEVYVVAGDWKWSDLGSFEAIEKITGKDPRKIE